MEGTENNAGGSMGISTRIDIGPAQSAKPMLVSARYSSTLPELQSSRPTSTSTEHGASRRNNRGQVDIQGGGGWADVWI